MVIILALTNNFKLTKQIKMELWYRFINEKNKNNECLLLTAYNGYAREDGWPWISWYEGSC